MLEPIDELLYCIFNEYDFNGIDINLIPQFKLQNKEGVDSKVIINEVLDTITPIGKDVIQLRFGLKDDNCYSLKMIGDKYSVTPERIRQREAKAIRQLRHFTRSRRLEYLKPSSYEVRCAFARQELYEKLSKLYPSKIALTVSQRVHNHELYESLKSTEQAIKYSCGRNISYCEHCGKPLPPGFNFCDIHCRTKWNVIPIVCDVCGKTFSRSVRDIIRKSYVGSHKGELISQKKYFCSNECKYKRGAGAFSYTRVRNGKREVIGAKT